MNRYIAKFKQCWFLIMDGQPNPYAYPLRDFLLSLGDDPSPTEIVSKAAVDFCTDEGKWNGCEIALSAIMYFMAETSEILPQVGDLQAANDLRRILMQGANRNAIVQWAKGFYPPPTRRPTMRRKRRR